MLPTEAVADEASEATDAPTEPETVAPTQAEVELEHYHKICELNVQVAEAHDHYLDSKETANHAKKLYERKAEQLSALISNGPNPQRNLPFTEETEATEAEAVVVDESWKLDSLDTLFDPEQTIRKALAEAGINTVGDLAAYTAEKRLIDIPGIGEGKAAKIEERMEEYWAERAAADATPVESDAVDFVDDMEVE